MDLRHWLKWPQINRSPIGPRHSFASLWQRDDRNGASVLVQVLRKICGVFGGYLMNLVKMAVAVLLLVGAEQAQAEENVSEVLNILTEKGVQDLEISRRGNGSMVRGRRGDRVIEMFIPDDNARARSSREARLEREREERRQSRRGTVAEVNDGTSPGRPTTSNSGDGVTNDGSQSGAGGQSNDGSQPGGSDGSGSDGPRGGGQPNDGTQPGGSGDDRPRDNGPRDNGPRDDGPGRDGPRGGGQPNDGTQPGGQGGHGPRDKGDRGQPNDGTQPGGRNGGGSYGNDGISPA